MIELQRIIDDKLLLREFTGYSPKDFIFFLKQYEKNIKRKRHFSIINTPEKQVLFILFSANVTMTFASQAILFGAKDKRTIHKWRKALDISSVYIKRYKKRITSLADFLHYANTYRPKRVEKKIKTIGDFFKKHPNIQIAIKQKIELIVPVSISATPMEDESRRLRIVASTVDNKRLCKLMDFRKEILENSDLFVEQAIQLIYIARYKDLGDLSIKEMAYLWGVSVEYMSRVLKQTYKKLELSEEKFKEMLFE
jgi:hypothetical protein